MRSILAPFLILFLLLAACGDESLDFPGAGDDSELDAEGTPTPTSTPSATPTPASGGGATPPPSFCSPPGAPCAEPLLPCCGSGVCLPEVNVCLGVPET